MMVMLARVMLSILPFQTVSRIASRSGRENARAGRIPVERIAWAISAVARRLPGTSCLPTAVAGVLLFGRCGYRATLRIGVTKAATGAIAAHAWVDCEGHEVLGAPLAGTFTPLPMRFGQ